MLQDGEFTVHAPISIILPHKSTPLSDSRLSAIDCYSLCPVQPSLPVPVGIAMNQDYSIAGTEGALHERVILSSRMTAHTYRFYSGAAREISPSQY